MGDDHDWPFEKSPLGSVRPWFLSATGYLVALFVDADEAERAKSGLLDQGVSDADIRLYSSEDILSVESERSDASSMLAKAVAALTADHAVQDLYLGTAKAGGVALWVFSPTDEAVNRFLRLFADYDYILLRYYGAKGVVNFHTKAD